MKSAFQMVTCIIGVPFLCISLLTACTSSPVSYFQKGPSAQVEKHHITISKEEKDLRVPASEIITLPYSAVSAPIVMGKEMYIAVNTKWGSLPDEVRKIDLDNKKETILFKTEHSPSAINDLQGNEEWLVWVDSTEDGYNNSIWAQN